MKQKAELLMEKRSLTWKEHKGHCCQCLHWEEETMDDDGRARCGTPRSAPEVSWPIYIYVQGDYGCSMFEVKTAYVGKKP